MIKSSLKINVLANLLQVLSSALLLLVLYKFLIVTIGIERLGIWAIVVSVASFAKVTDLGLGAAITRLVAVEISADQGHAAARIIETGLVTTIILISLVLLAISPVLNFILSWILEPVHRLETLDLLPYALFSLWISVICSLVMSGLDGCQRMVARAILVTIAQVLMVLVAIFMVPIYGVKGILFGQIIQAIFILIMGWFLLRRIFPSLPFVPWRWNRLVFKSLLRYSLNVQGGSLMMLFFEPITKMMLAKFGGLALTGLFELTLQVVLKIRSMIVAAYQAVIPRVAELSMRGNIQTTEFYCFNIKIIIFLTLILYSILSIWSGPISIIFLGSVDLQFVMIYQIVLLGWLLNSLCIPAYFFNLGSGSVGINTVASAGMGLINVSFGPFLGFLFGGIGILIGYSVALIVSSIWLILTFHHRSEIGYRDFFSRENVLFSLWCATLLVTNLILLFTSDMPHGSIFHFVIAISLSVLTVIGAIRHPTFGFLSKQLWFGNS